MTEVIAFTKVRLPYGWLGSMSPHPIQFAGTGLVYPTGEHLFQALRFSPEDPLRDEIRETRSPMAAKWLARSNDAKMVVERCSDTDVGNMRLVVLWKIEQHPDLRQQLIETGSALIVEDVTNRVRGAALFWGAVRSTKIGGNGWQGDNVLGKLWMERRGLLRRNQP